jgi:uncharacterized iron-regulated membrane protein
VGRLIRGITIGAALVAGVTWVALEGSDVANLRTARADGEWRETHVWVVEEGESLWVEAATPERAWLLDIEANPLVEVERAESSASYRASPAPGPGARDQLRAALHEKYGWADAWVGLFQDTSRAVAVRLDPID